MMGILAHFFIYSFLGWCVEVIYYYAKKQKFVNRGFLRGPLCPIYGIGFLGLYSSTNVLVSQIDNIYAIILIAFLWIMLVTTLVEGLGGLGLYVFFHTRWWDYSQLKYQLYGLVSLRFSIIWGLVGLGTYQVLHPLIIAPIIALIPSLALNVGVSIVFVLFIYDLVVTVTDLIQFKTLLTEVRYAAFSMSKDESVSRFERISQFMRSSDKFHTLKSRWNELRMANEHQELSKSKGMSVMDKFIEKLANNRFAKSFPDMRLRLLRRISKKEDNDES